MISLEGLRGLGRQSRSTPVERPNVFLGLPRQSPAAKTELAKRDQGAPTVRQHQVRERSILHQGYRSGFGQLGRTQHLPLIALISWMHVRFNSRTDFQHWISGYRPNKMYQLVDRRANRSQFSLLVREQGGAPPIRSKL